MTGRLGSGAAESARQAPPGVRVVVDVRPLQEPDRAPTTAIYLGELLAAFSADPLTGESFALLLQAGQDDPTTAPQFAGLDVIGRRLLPPTRLLRAGALTLDPFLLRGASMGIAWRADRGGAAGAVYHAAAGAAPLGSGLPVVVTLLDLAPWELPGVYQSGTAARFGQRLRGRILRDAAGVIVGSAAAARAARRLLRIRRDRIHIVRLAARSDFVPEARAHAAAEIARLGLPQRYFVYPGRHDARHDLGTLLRAIASLASRRPETSELWPPQIVLVGASPDDRAALAKAAAREGIGDFIAYAPHLPPDRLAAVVAGARAVILPALSESAGLTAIEAIACGVPVIASSVGVLPSIVGGAGVLVEPREVDRLAVALATVWSDEAVHRQLAADARARADGERRTWADVAHDTRAVYASVAATAGAGARSG